MSDEKLLKVLEQFQQAIASQTRIIAELIDRVKALEERGKE